MSLISHLFTSSVHATLHLVRSIIGFKTFELDSHFDRVSFNKQFHHQQLGATIDGEFDQLLTLCDPMQLWTILWARDTDISCGCLSCLWLEVNLIYQHRDLGMVLPYVIRSHFHLYLLYVMVVKHRFNPLLDDFPKLILLRS